ncbi:hypothetical protein V8E53_009716 [Lactarius tabidus]
MQASFIAILVIFASAVAPALSTPIDPMNDDYIAFSACAQTVPYVGRPFPLKRADSTATLSEIPSVMLVLSSPGKPPNMKAPVFHHLITHTSFPPTLAIKPRIYASYSHSVLQYGLSTFLELHQDNGSRYVGEYGNQVSTSVLLKSAAEWVLARRRCHEVRGRVVTDVHQKFAAAAMFTCFWAVNVFVPKLRIHMERDTAPPVRCVFGNVGDGLPLRHRPRRLLSRSDPSESYGPPEVVMSLNLMVARPDATMVRRPGGRKRMAFEFGWHEESMMLVDSC